MRALIAARTHVGNVRTRNEDAFVIGFEPISRSMDAGLVRSFEIETPLLLGVADGIGGHAAGDVASETAVVGLAMHSYSERGALAEVLHAIDASLLARGDDPSTYRMGTTFCGMLLGPQPVGLVVGDGFLGVRAGRALQPFGPSWDDVAASMAIDSALGGRDPSSPLVLSWRTMPFVVGGRYVVASDGIVRATTYEAFAAAIREGRDPKDCLDRIFMLGLAGIAPDNITCIIAEVTADS